MQLCFPKSKYNHHAIVTNVWHKPECYEVVHMTGDFDTFLDIRWKGIAEVRKEKKQFDVNDELRFYDYGENSIDRVIKKVYNIRNDNASENIVAKRACVLYDAFKFFRKNVYYKLLKFNCEHLASYCATGKAFCKQKDVFVDTENTFASAMLDKK